MKAPPTAAPSRKMHPPILMLHGNPTWSFYFRRLITALRMNHRVIVPDHIGMGLSDKPGEPQYEFTLARRVSTILKNSSTRSISAAPSTLVLHDWGAHDRHGLRHPATPTASLRQTRHPQHRRLLPPQNQKNALAAQPRPLARFPRRPSSVRGLNAFSRGDTSKIAMTSAASPKTSPARLSRRRTIPGTNRLAVHRFIQDIPLAPGDRALRYRRQCRKESGPVSGCPDAHLLGHERFRLRYPLPPIAGSNFFRRRPSPPLQRTPATTYSKDAHERIIPLVKQFIWILDEAMYDTIIVPRKCHLEYRKMHWQDRIVVNPEILAGKPIIKGTRLAADFLLELLAADWSEAEILATIRN